MQEVYFIGIDLAFSPKNNSGVSIVSGQPSGGPEELNYISSRLCKTDEEIVTFLQPYLIPGHSVVAVDAPLVVPNKTGMRPCERAIGRMYGNRQCGAYPAHQGNMAGTRGPTLLKYMESCGVPVSTDARVQLYGYVDADFDANFNTGGGASATGSASASVPFFETYPHAAHLSMFDLPTVWKYKKKSKRTWETCRSELVEYWRRLWSLLPKAAEQVFHGQGVEPDDLGVRILDWVPAIKQLGDAPQIVGKRYKEFEDLTDGLFCAYIAAHIGRGGSAVLFSPLSTGSTGLSLYREGDDFIIVPAP